MGVPADRREACDEVGRVTSATQVDHKTPVALGGTDDWSNLQSICDDCHARKTAREVRSLTGKGGAG